MAYKEDTERGFAWLVLLCSFLCTTTIGINITCFGVLLTHIGEHFEVGMTLLGLLAAVRTGLLYLSGVISGNLVNHFGSRLVYFFASALLSTGYLAGAYAEDFNIFFLAVGICTGIATGLQFICPIVIVQHYFNKRRIVANGICMAGFAAGTALFGLISGVIIQEITWRNTLILLAALNIQTIVASSFFFLKKPGHGVKTKDGAAEKIDDEEIVGKDADHEDEQNMNSQWTICVHFCDMIQHYIVDFSVFRNASFSLYFITFIPAFSSIMSYIQLGPNRAYVQGIDKVSSNYVATAIGSGSFFGRLFSGVFGNRRFVSTHIHYGISVCCAGVFALLSILAKGSLALHMVFSGLYGFSMGNAEGVNPMVVLDLLGVDRLAQGIGFIQGAKGISSLISISLAGWLFDRSGGYLVPFLYLGGMTFIGGFGSFLISLTKRNTQTVR